MSCDVCGWAAAVGSMLAFGSFGVPIKGRIARSVDIDPLVFQSYKTFMCFCTSLLILAFEKPEFTPWGIVSGLFWVPGGVATVYAVKTAGLAIGIGIGSSFIVLVSFVWGIFVFQERVHSKFGACCAIASMMLGLIGMSYYSSPVVNHFEEEQDGLVHVADDNENRLRVRQGVQYQGLTAASQNDDDGDDCNVVNGTDYCNVVNGANDCNVMNGLDDEEAGDNTLDSNKLDPALKLTDRTAPYSDSPTDSVEGRDGEDEEDNNTAQSTDPNETDELSTGSSRRSISHSPETIRVVCGVKMTQRHLGMLSAAFCGVWGGSIMAPMKWCKSDTKGTHYLLSFAIGASIVTLAMWLFRYLANAVYFKSFSQAYDSLPSFHIHVMWLPGGISGLLWSIGNFFSLISVFYLGEGVGYPLVQTSILVSGLWGIFYFKEVTGTERISKWLISSLLTIFGILLLSYEHHEK